MKTTGILYWRYLLHNWRRPYQDCIPMLLPQIIPFPRVPQGCISATGSLFSLWHHFHFLVCFPVQSCLLYMDAVGRCGGWEMSKLRPRCRYPRHHQHLVGCSNICSSIDSTMGVESVPQEENTCDADVFGRLLVRTLQTQNFPKRTSD